MACCVYFCTLFKWLCIHVEVVSVKKKKCMLLVRLKINNPLYVKFLFLQWNKLDIFVEFPALESLFPCSNCPILISC